MLGHSADARNLVNVGYVEGLNAAVVENAPHFNHAFSIGSYKTVQRAKTVYTD